MEVLCLDYEQRLKAAEAKRAADLELLRVELTGSAEDAEAARTAREKEERMAN